MPFTHNIDPVLFYIGQLDISYYRLAYLLGVFIIFFYLKYMIKTKRLDLTTDELLRLMIYLVFFMLLFNKLFEVVIWNPGLYLKHPSAILNLWKAGNSFHGGLLGVFIAVFLFCRNKEIKNKGITWKKIGDYISIPFMLIGALVKIANFINAELVGKITDVSWCVYFPGYSGCRHPQQLYSAARLFALFGWLVFLIRKDHKEGFIFWNMIAGYGILRLLLDFFREDATFLGLSTGQYLSLVMFLLGGFVLMKYYKKDLKRIFSRKA